MPKTHFLCYNKPMKKKILGLFVTFVFFAFILYKIDVDSVLMALNSFTSNSLIYIVAFYALSLLLRGIRWKLFLNNAPKYSWLQLSEIFTIGTMLNIFLPARAGDVYRAYYLGNIKHEKKMKIFGSVILERLFDGSALFAILLFATLRYFAHSNVINCTVTIAGTLFVGSIIIAFLLIKTGQLSKVLDFIEKTLGQKNPSLLKRIRIYILSFAEGFSVLNKPLSSTCAFGYSIAIWALECIVAYLIINSFGVNFPISASLFVVSLITFSTMIPSTSIFLGPFQAAYILALGIYGVDKEFALAVSVVHNVILTLIVSIIGLYCLLKTQLVSKKDTPNS